MGAPQDLRSEIRRLTTVLLERDLALDFREPILTKVDRITSLTWATLGHPAPMVVSGQFAVVPEYRRMLRNGHYTCLLHDGSLLQISARYRDDELIAHRFC